MCRAGRPRSGAKPVVLRCSPFTPQCPLHTRVTLRLFGDEHEQTGPCPATGKETS
jgi:hypothetical protein